MSHTLLLLPHLHGALGWWDEIINLIPVVIGIVLVVYLYRARHRRRRPDDETPEAPEPTSTRH